MIDEKKSLVKTLERIVERIQALFQNPVVIRDESKVATSHYRGILFYYLVMTLRPWKFFRFLAPRQPLFLVIPYFSDNPNEEKRKQLSYVVWGDENVLRVVNEELRKFADEFGFIVVLELHAPHNEEISPMKRFWKELNSPV